MRFPLGLGVLAYAASGALAQTVIDLSSLKWTVTEPTHNISIPGAVPSQAHLDLLAAGIIDEPTYGLQYRSILAESKANAEQERMTRTTNGLHWRTLRILPF